MNLFSSTTREMKRNTETGKRRECLNSVFDSHTYFVDSGLRIEIQNDMEINAENIYDFIFINTMILHTEQCEIFLSCW